MRFQNAPSRPAFHGTPTNRVPSANQVPDFSKSFSAAPGGAATTVGKTLPATPGRLQFTPVSPSGANSAAQRTATTPHDRLPAGLRFDSAHRIGRAGLLHRHLEFVFRHDGRMFRRNYLRHGQEWFWYDTPLDDDDSAAVADDPTVPDCDPTSDTCEEPAQVQPDCDPSTSNCSLPGPNGL